MNILYSIAIVIESQLTESFTQTINGKNHPKSIQRGFDKGYELISSIRISVMFTTPLFLGLQVNIIYMFI